MPAATFDPVKDLPHPLLATNEHSDFTRNFREMQKHSKRPYSLTRVLRSFCKTPPRFDGFEQEVHEELSSLNRARSVVGKLVPIQALSTLKRDLSIAGYPQIVQTTVADAIIPFLRAKTTTLQSLQKELTQLRERVEDLEDLYELREAWSVTRASLESPGNRLKPSWSWAKNALMTSKEALASPDRRSGTFAPSLKLRRDTSSFAKAPAGHVGGSQASGKKETLARRRNAVSKLPLIRTGFCQANVVFWFWQSLALLESRFNIFIDDLDQPGEGCYPVFVVADASQK